MKRLDADRFFLSRLKGFSNCNYHFVFGDKGKNFLKSVARFSSLIITETQLLKQRSRLVLSCCWVFIGTVLLDARGSSSGSMRFAGDSGTTVDSIVEELQITWIPCCIFCVTNGKQFIHLIFWNRTTDHLNVFKVFLIFGIIKQSSCRKYLSSLAKFSTWTKVMSHVPNSLAEASKMKVW